MKHILTSLLTAALLLLTAASATAQVKITGIVVDEKVPHTLPNLDYKFMQGNSLITTFHGEYINLNTKEQKILFFS